MSEGKRSRLTDEWSQILQATYGNLTLATTRQQLVFDDMLQLRDDRVGARRKRLEQAQQEVTAPVWFLLGLGAVVNIAFVLLFIDRRDESLGVLIGLMATVTTMVVSGLLLIWYSTTPTRTRAAASGPPRCETCSRSCASRTPHCSRPARLRAFRPRT